MDDRGDANAFTIRDLQIWARVEVVTGDGSVAVVTLAPTGLGNWSATGIETPDGRPISPEAVAALRRIEESAGLALWADGVRIEVTSRG